MYKSLSILFFLSLCFSFEVEEKLSITELKEEAELFILNQSYIDAISNYEKIFEIFRNHNRSISRVFNNT